MTKRDVLAVALKVLGVYCVIQAVASLPIIGSALSWRGEPSREAFSRILLLASAILLPIIYIAIALVLWRKADSFAEKLIREDSPLPAMRDPGWEKQVFVLAIRIIGVVCFPMAIPELGKGIRELALMLQYHDTTGTVLIARAFSFVHLLLLLALGAYLLSGAKRIVGFVFRQNER